MEISEMVPALLGGMSIAAVVLLGVRLMLGPNEKRYENAPVEPRDAITSAKTRLRQGIDELDARLRNIEVGFARINQRLETLEQVILPATSPNAK